MLAAEDGTGVGHDLLMNEWPTLVRTGTTGLANHLGHGASR